MTLPPEDHRLRPDHAPTGFSAAQIRAGCPVGRTIRVRSERRDEPTTHRVIRFVDVDDDGSLQEFQATEPDGRPIGDVRRHRSTWLELQRHASQPAAATVIEEVDLSLRFGVEACWRYTVTAANGVTIFWFAKRLPGMPMRVEEWSGDALIGRTVVVENAPRGG